MVKVFFVSENIQVEVPEGSSLLEITKKFQLPFPFGCRRGSCGTCRCLIEEGEKNLNPKTEAEEELFETFTSVGVNERLGCQLIIYGDVKIRS